MGNGTSNDVSGNIAGIDDVRGTPWSKRSPIMMGNRTVKRPTVIEEKEQLPTDFEQVPQDLNTKPQETIAQPDGTVTPGKAAPDPSLDGPEIIRNPDGTIGFGVKKPTQTSDVPWIPKDLASTTNDFGPNDGTPKAPELNLGALAASLLTPENLAKLAPIGAAAEVPVAAIPLPSETNPNAPKVTEVSTKTETPTGFNGLHFVLNELEGGTPYKESNGDVTKFGIGSGYSKGIDVKDVDEAARVFDEKYAKAGIDGVKGGLYNQLKDEYDKASYANLLLNRPDWARQFNENYQGEVGGPEWRDALLKFQADKYASSPDRNVKGLLNRVDKIRKILPSANV
jgi:hypothetical protein